MRLILACLLASVAATAQAQSTEVYTWKDARGVTHYSDTPPPSGRYGSVATAPAPRAAAEAIAAAKVDPRCTTARTNIANLKSGRTDIGLDTDRDGKVDKPLEESQRADQLRLAEASARNFCKDAP